MTLEDLRRRWEIEAIETAEKVVRARKNNDLAALTRWGNYLRMIERFLADLNSLDM